MVVERLISKLERPVDAASLHAFRVVFGLLMAIAGLRFFSHDWIVKDFGVPRFFFSYWGLDWLKPLPVGGMMIVYGLIIGSALLLASGVGYRVATGVFALCFTYAHLCDKANYLNHYYLITLIAWLLVLLPLRPGCAQVPTWVLWLLRFQFAVVYVYGGLGKIGSDWLLQAQPLRLWLGANVELPVLGRLFDHTWVAYCFSWAGLLFDLSIVPLLLWRRTRVVAYVAAFVFHALTSVLFNIGLFPWLMLAGGTLFFEPAWPRRWWRAKSGAAITHSLPTLPVALYVAVQLLVPLRAALYPGNTLWSEEGFRFAWRVMLIEKSGELEYTIVENQQRRTVDPSTHLTRFQLRMVSTQPDMILQLAHDLAKTECRLSCQVFASAEVSFNGRPHAPLIDPTVDLSREEEGLAHKRWILPAPETPPEF